MRRVVGTMVSVLLLASLLAGCAAPTPQVIEKEKVVEKPVVQTVVVEKEKVVEKPVVQTVVVEKVAPGGVQEWELVNPEGIVQVKEPIKLAPRPSSLEGLTIGLRANGKHNSDAFLQRVAELLEEQVKNVKVIKLWEAVPGSFGYPLKEEDLQKIVALKPDLVIGSQAD